MLDPTDRIKRMYSAAGDALGSLTEIVDWRTWVIERTHDHITPRQEFAVRVSGLCKATAECVAHRDNAPEGERGPVLGIVLQFAEDAIPRLVRALDPAQYTEMVRNPSGLAFDANRVNPLKIGLEVVVAVQRDYGKYDFLKVARDLQAEMRAALANSSSGEQPRQHEQSRREPTRGTVGWQIIQKLREAPGEFVATSLLPGRNPRSAISTLNRQGWSIESAQQASAAGADVPSGASGYRLRP